MSCSISTTQWSSAKRLINVTTCADSTATISAAFSSASTGDATSITRAIAATPAGSNEPIAEPATGSTGSILSVAEHATITTTAALAERSRAIAATSAIASTAVATVAEPSSTLDAAVATATDAAAAATPSGPA